jgi:phosphatidylinositol-4,5-bisphosphate 3-kinase
MPELENANDVKYLQDQLALNISDQEATALFRSSIKNSLNDQWRNIDNFIHNLKRKG